MGKQWWVFLAFLASLSLSAVPALAGTLQVRDTSDLLTSEQEGSLRERARQYPFDVRVVTSDAHSSREAFDQYIAEQVSEANIVVVGVDPSHRRTSVHFGKGTRIAPVEYQSVRDVGGPHFKDKDYAGGIAAMLDRAAQAVGTGPALTRGVQPVAAARASSGPSVIVIVVLGVVFMLVIVTIASAMRRRAQGPSAYGPGQYGGGGPGAGGYGPPQGGYYGGGYGGGGGSGIGTGIAGAAVGGLVGYELGKAAGERHHDHGDGYSGADTSGSGGASDDGGGFDAGGSTGGWDDSGGGGGDFGGGGDSGGGGDW